jgi:hypothetical protein
MTTEQADAFAQLRRLATPARLRVRPDAEGWPVIPGRLGQFEYHDGMTWRSSPADRGCTRSCGRFRVCAGTRAAIEKCAPCFHPRPSSRWPA